MVELSLCQRPGFVLFTDKAASAEGARNERFSPSKVCQRQTGSLSFRSVLTSPLVTYISQSSSTPSVYTAYRRSDLAQSLQNHMLWNGLMITSYLSTQPSQHWPQALTMLKLIYCTTNRKCSDIVAFINVFILFVEMILYFNQLILIIFVLELNL